jgi:hypothetical protein
MVLDPLVRAGEQLAGIGIILRGWRVVCLSGVVRFPPDGR